VGRLTEQVPITTPIEVHVSRAPGSALPVVLRGWVRAPGPVAVPVTPVVYCLAGGRCSAGYFDLRVGGHEGYSMADHFAVRGAVVVAVDHLGLGASDPVDDPFTVTPTVLAHCHHQAVRDVLGRLRAGSLVPGFPALTAPFPVGLGHSMGAMLAGVQQARHRSFGALVLLGHGGSGLPEVLTDEELAVAGPDLPSIEDEIVRLARARFGANSAVPRKKPRLGTFFAEDVPAAARAAFARQAVPLLPSCGLASMIPLATSSERAAIDVPTFLGFGDRDLTDDYAHAVRQYASVTDPALFVLEGSGHCHNQASGRQLLWDRILSWITTVA
jgi:Alpha/beta hydrolase family